MTEISDTVVTKQKASDCCKLLPCELMQKKPSAVKMQFKMAFLLLYSSVLGYSVELLSLQWFTKLCTDIEIRKLLNTILHVTSVL